MTGLVTRAYQRVEDARPFVRPTYSDLEVQFLPPFGDPEVHIVGAIGTYLAAGVVLTAVTERLQNP
jgi:hypothetical protein